MDTTVVNLFKNKYDVYIGRAGKGQESNSLFSIQGKKNYLGYDNYLPFEGNWPDWTLEAYKTLEL